MKLFVIYQFLPYPPTDGAAIYIYHRLARLRPRHDIVLFAPTRRPSDPESIEELRKEGWQIETVSKPKGISKAEAIMSRIKALPSPIPAHWVLSWDDAIGAAIQQQIRAHKPEVVVIEHLISWRFARYVRQCTDAPIVLVSHNVEHLWETRAARQFGYTFNGILRRSQALKVRALEKAALEASLTSFAISESDRDLLKQLAPTASVQALPVGVDVDHYALSQDDEDNETTVFTSSLNVATNIDGARWLVEQVLPVLHGKHGGAKVDLVGRDPAPAVRAMDKVPGVSVYGDVPDVRPYMAKAAVYAVPTWPESGVRLKILEASAMGKAIVSTSKAAQGLDLVDGQNVLIRDDPESFADAIAHLLINRSERHRIGKAAREFAMKYSWEASNQIFEDHLREALAKRA